MSDDGMRVVQRVVFPPDRDLDVMPLYVDGSQGTGGTIEESDGTTLRIPSGPSEVRPDHILDRRRLLVPMGKRASLATYFNAFPASYWRRWTVAESVVLKVKVVGDATVVVYRSNSRGNSQRVASERVGPGSGDLTFTLTLAPFADGGWYWFDVLAGREDAVLERAEWLIDPVGRSRGRVSLGITTFNRPSYCLAQLRNLGRAADLLEVLDEIIIVDQGTDRVEAQPDFAEASAPLSDRLRVIVQPNLGGSGGFARSMHEVAAKGASDYVLLLDDDVVVETEGILRAMAFADLARVPTIVGGHMFSMYARSVLHAFAERVDRYRWFWGPAKETEQAHDFSIQNLRETPWLHRRVDVDYNGWWMCLIPTQVVLDIGLALPVFIKWDDAEYGLRAAQNDTPTVSLPGAAVWHVPWTEKDDTVDWQAYHHARNRLLTALLYSPYDHGGQVLYVSLNTQLKHAMSLQYSAAELRLHAIENLLEGPEHLHRDLPTKLADIREFRSTFTDAVVSKDPGGFPPARRVKPPRKGREPSQPKGRVGVLKSALAGVVHQALPVREQTKHRPELEVPAMDARWWMLSQFDSVVVSSAEGTGASWHRRDRARFASIMARSLRLHQRLRREWPRLRDQYRSVLPDLVSSEQWSTTFHRDSSD